MQARSLGGALAALVALALGAAPASADKIKNPTAVFAGLDKITGRIVSFEVAVDETVQFGALQMTPRVCYTRPPTESPNTTAFIEVDEVTLENKYRRIFTGWTFAASPGLHGIEHAVYDVWLTDCKGGSQLIAEPKQNEADEPAPRPGDRRGRQQAEQRATTGEGGGGRIDVAPPRGTPTQPRQQPSRRFYPTNAGPGGFDPSGGNR